MKKILVLLLLLPLLTFAQNDGCAADEMRASVMDVLTGLKEGDYAKYKALFITGDQISSLIDQLDMNEEMKEEIRKERNQDFIDEYTNNEFKDLLEESADIGLNWANITYDDFLYKLRLSTGVKELKGELYFSEGDAHYEIRIMAAFIDGKCVLLEMEHLDTSYELYPEEYTDEYDEESLEELERALEELEALGEEEEVIALPQKEEIITALTALYDALKKKDYETAKTYVAPPLDWDEATLNKKLKEIVDNDNLTPSGIEMLRTDGYVGPVDEVYGERGITKAENAGLNPYECYALYDFVSNAECMFFWDGLTIRFYRLDDIRME